LEVAAAAATPTLQIPLPLGIALDAVEEGFFSLCVAAGRRVLGEMMELDRTALCGPKWTPNPEREAHRAGSAPSEVTLGGRRVALRRPRVRSLVGHELELPSFAFASQRDPLDRRTLEAIAVGVSTRNYVRSLEELPAGEKERSVSKSAVSRRFVALSARQLGEWLSRPLGELGIRIVLVDGLVLGEHTVLLALGIDGEGHKHVLGLREGTTENATVARTLLADLADRGLDGGAGVLFVIDGAKGLRKAVRVVFGNCALVQRCQVHKTRNVLDHLPEEKRASVRRAMRDAYELDDAKKAERILDNLARALEHEHPGAAGSLREGLEETLTLQRLGVTGWLYRTLRSTNSIENLNGLVGDFTANVKHWRSGNMVMRWVGAGIQEASRRFRRLRGYKGIPTLLAALERHVKQGELDIEKKVA
jgi:transposase-like protein